MQVIFLMKTNIYKNKKKLNVSFGHLNCCRLSIISHGTSCHKNISAEICKLVANRVRCFNILTVAGGVVKTLPFI